MQKVLNTQGDPKKHVWAFLFKIIAIRFKWVAIKIYNKKISDKKL